MKYLDYPILTHLSDALSDLPTPEYKVQARIEVYSVKPIGKEKKMYKEMEEAYMSGQDELEEMSFSPEMREAGLSSAFGRLDEKESRKVHFLIVSLLNTAFPDHDFSSLRPDQFTREPSAAQVLSNVTSNFASATGNAAPQVISKLAISPAARSNNLHGIHQTMSSSLGSSPSGPPPSMANPDLYRLLGEVIPLDAGECEVYSWFPEPEYDPHLEPEEDDMSEDGYDEEEVLQTPADEMDLDDPSWGQAGMELDDLPESDPMTGRRSSGGKKSPLSGGDGSFSSGGYEGHERRKGGLLWSQNYFFYSRRMKRVLFLSCWCRRRPSHVSQPIDEDLGAFPVAISSSFSSPSFESSSLSPLRVQKAHRYSAKHKSSHRKSRPNPASSGVKGDLSATIPIRGMETPRPSRLASSAPSTYATPSPQVQQAAMAKMTAGGFKPRQTPARVLLNAAAASHRQETIDLTSPVKSGISAERVRKERSESATPVPSNALLDNIVNVDKNAAGKRVKV